MVEFIFSSLLQSIAIVVHFYIDLLSYLAFLNRYLVLANMLMESEVNPFDGQEAKP